jgi:hypothetical protein
MYFIWCAFSQVSQKIKVIFCLNKYKNIWYDLTFFIYTQKLKKNIYVYIFGFNNQFIEHERTCPIFQ